MTGKEKLQNKELAQILGGFTFDSLGFRDYTTYSQTSSSPEPSYNQNNSDNSGAQQNSQDGPNINRDGLNVIGMIKWSV